MAVLFLCLFSGAGNNLRSSYIFRMQQETLFPQIITEPPQERTTGRSQRQRSLRDHQKVTASEDHQEASEGHSVTERSLRNHHQIIMNCTNIYELLQLQRTSENIPIKHTEDTAGTQHRKNQTGKSYHSRNTVTAGAKPQQTGTIPKHYSSQRNSILKLPSHQTGNNLRSRSQTTSKTEPPEGQQHWKIITA